MKNKKRIVARVAVLAIVGLVVGASFIFKPNSSDLQGKLKIKNQQQSIKVQNNNQSAPNINRDRPSIASDRNEPSGAPDGNESNTDIGSFQQNINAIVVNSTSNRSDDNTRDNNCYTGHNNSTGDIECSLRAAIEHANANPDLTTIEFDIPDSDPGYDSAIDKHIITIGDQSLNNPGPSYMLPSITTPIVIDGGNLEPIPIRLEGSGVSSGTALNFRMGSDGSTVDNMQFYNFSGRVIELNRVNNVTIENSNMDNANSSVAVYLGTQSSNNRIANNKIGNSEFGIKIWGTSNNNLIEDNSVANNELYAMHISAGSSNNQVLSNEFSYNGNRPQSTGGAIKIDFSSIDNRVSQNSIFSNGGIGIDLVDPQDIPNQETPNDIGNCIDCDSGPNNLQNYPEVQFVSVNSINGTLNLNFDLPTQDNQQYIIEVFANFADERQGKLYLGSIDNVSAGYNSSTLNISSFEAQNQINRSVGNTVYITMTASDASGNTSEFSAPFTTLVQ